MGDFFHTIGGKIAAAITGIFLLFSGAPHTATNTRPLTQTASAVVAVANTSGVAQTQPNPTASGAAATTVVNNYITQPVIERTVQTAASPTAGGYVTQNEFATKLNELSNKVGTIVYGNTYPVPATNYGSGGLQNIIALSNKIDSLSGTHLSNITVSGVSGLTISDLPTLNYLSSSGGTLSGDLTITGNFTVSGAQTLSGAITVPYISATSTSLDSNFVRFTATNATTTNATSTNLYTSILYAPTASTTNLTFINATGTSATTTNFFSTNASSTNLHTSNLFVASLSGFLKATAGAVATALVNLASDVTGILPTANGGTGWANIAASAIPYGNGSGALATTTAGTAGYVLSYLNGVPTWTATTTLSTISGTLAVTSGGTGQTSFGQGWLSSDGTTLSASTSPTVNYITATSTTGTNFFAGFINTSGTTGGYKIDGNLILQASSTNALTKVGISALANYFDTTSTDGPTALGYQALNAATSSIGETAVGYQALKVSACCSISQATIPKSNTAIGYQALSALTYGRAWTAIGYQAGANGTTVNNNTAIGYQAMLGGAGSFTGEDNTAIGLQALTAITTGSNNIAIGEAAAKLTASPNNIAIGNGALSRLTSNATGQNIAIGRNTIVGTTNGDGGSNNVAVGDSALFKNSSGIFNTAFGTNALNLNTTGSDNFALGGQALQNNTTGTENIAIGIDASRKNNSATSTVAIGSEAAAGPSAYNAQGYTVIGYNAGTNFTTGSDYNTLFGYQAGYGITTGSNNIWIGTATSSTGIANLTTGSQNILIGNNISLPSATANGQLNIGNIIYGTSITTTGSTLSTGNIGIATTSPWRKLSVTGTVGFDGLTAGAGAGSLCLSANKEVVYSDNAGCTGSSQRFKHSIETLDSTSGIAEAMKLRPVSFVYNDDIGVKGPQVGFIAEDVAQIDERLITRDASGTPNNVKYTNMVAIAIKAIQDITNISGAFKDKLIAWFGSATNGIGDFFANRVIGNQLCAKKSDGTLTCVTGDQLAAAVSGSTQTSAGGGAFGAASGSATADTEPPVITINGSNPAELNVGDTYSDLGASVVDNIDKNLGIKTFVGTTPIEFAAIDTSEAATYHINYVATDNAGNTATSTRTVIVKTPDATASSAESASESSITPPADQPQQ